MENACWGEHSVSIEDYKRNIEKEIAIMKKTGAKLVWCSTTPVPNSSTGQYARRKREARVFNNAAMEVIRRHPEIQINDLFKLVSNSDVFDDWRKGNNVHFRSAEQAVLGNAVAVAVWHAWKFK